MNKLWQNTKRIFSSCKRIITSIFGAAAKNTTEVVKLLVKQIAGVIGITLATLLLLSILLMSIPFCLLKNPELQVS